jgi:hypothetical protein
MEKKMSSPEIADPGSAAAPTGSGNAFPGGNASPKINPKADVAQANPIPSAEISQAKIEILLADLTDTGGWMVAQMNCLPNQRLAGDVDGFLHTLRRARCYWLVIAAEARLLVEAHGDLLSALRQEDQR